MAHGTWRGAAGEKDCDSPHRLAFVEAGGGRPRSAHPRILQRLEEHPDPRLLLARAPVLKRGDSIGTQKGHGLLSSASLSAIRRRAPGRATAAAAARHMGTGSRGHRGTWTFPEERDWRTNSFAKSSSFLFAIFLTAIGSRAQQKTSDTTCRNNRKCRPVRPLCRERAIVRPDRAAIQSIRDVRAAAPDEANRSDLLQIPRRT